jgi:hypothetical protein
VVIGDFLYAGYQGLPVLHVFNSVGSLLKQENNCILWPRTNFPCLQIAVPISVIAGFKKVKASVHNNVMLAAALRTSSKLVSLFILRSQLSFEASMILRF